MQPPPRAEPPGLPPPPVGVPNVFRRSSPYSRRANVPMSAAAAPVPPMTDPFAFGRQTPQNTPLGNPPPKSSPVPVQGPPPSSFTQPGPIQNQFAPTQTLGSTQGLHSVPSSSAGVNLFTPNSCVAPSPLPGHFNNSNRFASPTPHVREQEQLNSREHSHVQGSQQNSFVGLPHAAAPLQNRPPYGQDIRGDPISYNPTVPNAMPFPAQNMQPAATSWMPDYGSCPPSSQNYFQPGEHPAQQFGVPVPTSSPADIPSQTHPQNQVYSEQQPQVGQQNMTPFVGFVNSHPPPDKTEGSNPPVSQHHNPPFQSQNHFSQNYGSSNTWFNQPHQENFYHQPGAAETNFPSTNTGQAGLPPEGNHIPYESDTGTVSMFFKGNEVENEETLASEKKAMNSVPGGELFLQSQGQPLMGVDVAQNAAGVYQSFDHNVTGPINALSSCETGPYLNDSAFVSEPQKNAGVHFDNVENLECAPNLEVLPSNPLNIPPMPQTVPEGAGPVPGQENPVPHVADNFEGGPNLETPDSVLDRPVRSESVSSSYSNVSHGSASSSRRPQGVVGTFIQQEIAKPPQEVSAGYFEQVDSSPAGDAVVQNAANNVYHRQLSQPPTPSPPKPTGIFQASANSSFEPVRSYSVGVKPVEVDQARMVMEKNSGAQSNVARGAVVTDASPGNLEQPPDNLENIFMPTGQTPVGSPNNVLQPISKPSVETVQPLPDRRPSSRAHAPRLKCESPATTLWAQNEIMPLNILLAPAAPPVHVFVKQPSMEVIQPPEDGPLDQPLEQKAAHKTFISQKADVSSENLENPPQVGESDHLKQQASFGYATLLVSSPPTESFQNQPILIAHPTQNYSVVPPNNPPVSLPNQTHQVSLSEPLKNQGVEDMTVPVSQAPGINLTSGASAVQPGFLLSTSMPNCQPQLISVTPSLSEIVSNQPINLLIQPPPNQNPLNLALDSRHGMKSAAENTYESAAWPSNQAAATDPSYSALGQKANLSVLANNSQSQPAGHHQNATNHELLDFTMPRTQANQNQDPNQTNLLSSAGSQPPPPSSQGLRQGAQANNPTGFYLQVTKDAQQSAGTGQAPQKQTAPASQQTALKPQQSATQPGLHVNEGTPPTQSVQGPGPQNNQYPQSFPMVPGPQGVGAPNPPMGYGTTGPGGTQHPMYPPQPPNSQQPSLANSSQQPSQDLQRPTPSHTPQQMYGPPPQHPAAGYGYYGGGAYPEYPDGRHPYQQPYPPGDPMTAQPYYQEDPYRRYDPRYVRYEGYNPGYREGNRSQYPEQQERPSSRASQYSDRPSSRQGYSEDNYLKGGRSAYDDYYADYYKKQYDYGDRSQWDRYDPASYDPRYREYYEQQYWYNYDPEAYRRREQYYSQQYPRREGYDDRWQYDPRYDSSFDENAHPRDPYGDEYDRRSVHSEQSAHSVHSSHSQQSCRSSFSSRSQQSQVYRSQQDLVTAGYEAPTQPAAPADYSYGQYTDNVGGHQGFTGYQYPAQTGWQSVEQVPPRPVTPEKFTVPHICARFGPGGQLIKVLPNLPSEGQPALVEIHSMETMLQSTQEQEDLRAFPGPLAKEETHKVDVIKFSQNKAMECLRNDNLLDKDSASLIWEFIVLLCRQNGTVVGTDIADLLLRDHKSAWLPGKSPNETNLIDFNNEALDRAEEDPGSGQLSLLSDTFMSVPENVGKETERFRELLLFGRKKDSLECAMKHGLWGHALLLASKMDSRTHARVMTRFANSLPINDPLQTVYQLMSGRMPAAATCCGDEKWGDWRPHLAMVLSNLTNALDLDTRTISTMGDTLASKGLMDAAHFCYMMAQVGFGVYTKKSTKLVLLGSNHSLPFFKFASNEAIQRTEAYEYAQSLGSQTCLLPNFQVFKFIYACRLAEVGLSAQAFHYCEVISRTVLKRPSYYSPVFINQLIQMSAMLRFFDPQLKERPEQELFIEPDWLVRLHQLDGQIKEGAISYSSDRATPQQYACSSTPSSEFDHTSQTDGIGFPQDMTSNTSEIPLMTSLMPNAGPPVPGVQLMPPAPQTILDGTMPSFPSPQYAADVPFNPGPPQMQPAMQGSAHPSQGPMQGYAPPAMNPDPGFGAPYLPEQSYTGTPLPPQGSLNEALPTVPEQQQNHQPVERRLSSLPSSPTRNAFPPQGQMDFYDQMVHMAPGRRSRSTSQSSMHMGHGRRSRTTSESSSHSLGRDRRNSAGMQPTPPPPSIPEQPTRKPEQPKKDSPKKGGGGGWLSWLTRKGKNEAHLPDDKNKSIVWDEKKQRWVNQDEPEEESKPLPPPPPGFPKMGPQMAQMGPGGPPGSGPQVNMFSRKAAGTRGRYVDILNPGGVGTKPRGPAPAPADLFAPLAPMPIPANLFVPGAATDGGQPMEGSIAEAEPNTEQSNVDTQFNPAACPPGSEAPVNTDGTQSGELSRSSSMSSLSREVSQHFKQVPDQPPAHGGLPAGGVTFYNPSQFTQPAGPLAGTRAGRFSQRKYPAMK